MRPNPHRISRCPHNGTMHYGPPTWQCTRCGQRWEHVTHPRPAIRAIPGTASPEWF